jgi:hypothetical protein
MEQTMNNFTRSLLAVLAGGIISLAASMLMGRPTTEAATVKPFPLRQFYLTRGTFDGLNTPQNACAAGYHMASLWEILNVSNLRYDTSLGLAADDSGSGPPLYPAYGWIRTGNNSSPIPSAGVANCYAWTNNSTDNYGSAVGLSSSWANSPTELIDPWTTIVQPCGLPVHTWCVQD